MHANVIFETAISPHLNLALFKSILDPKRKVSCQTSIVQKSLTIIQFFPLMDSLNKN